MLSQIVRGLIYFFTLLLVVAGASLILFAIFPVERQLELLSHWAADGVADVDISHPILGMIPIVTGGVFVVISLLITRAHYKGYIGEKIIIYSQEMFWFAKTVYLGKRDVIITKLSDKIKSFKINNFSKKLKSYLQPIVRLYCTRFTSQSSFINSKINSTILFTDFDSSVTNVDDKFGFSDYLRSLSASD